MKYVIVIPDGAADVGMEELGGKTPLEAAVKPHMDAVATRGVIDDATIAAERGLELPR